MEYRATAAIDAPPDVVWAVLTDASAYATWEPNITKVDGAISPGSKITVHTKVSPDRAFPVTVTALDDASRMQWTGGMPLGLFKGVRTFTLQPDGEGTRFEMQEVFSGPLLFMMRRAMPDLQPSFDDFASALKARAEAA